METLNMTEAKAKKLMELEDDTLKVLSQAMKEERDIDETVVSAIKIQNMITKNRVTASAREAISLQAVQLTNDEKIMKKYVKASFPEIRKLMGK